MGQYVEREEELFVLRGALQLALCLEKKKKGALSCYELEEKICGI